MRARVFLLSLLLILPACADGTGSGIRRDEFTLESELMGMDLLEVGLVPPGLPSGARRPLLVFLHGLGGSSTVIADAWLIALEKLGERAPIVLMADGSRGRSYWHDRKDAPWGRHLLKELIPSSIDRLNADPNRVAIGGISMGGFGALDLARLYPGRFCAAGAHSAAIVRRFENTRPGAFDDADDFARHDIFAFARTDPALYGDTQVWLDSGVSDPYAPSIAAYAAILEAGETNVTYESWPGGHNDDYWQDHLDEYLDFYAGALASCP